MTRPIVNIINVATGEEVIREMNDAEYEQHLLDKAAYETRLAAEAAQEVTE